MESEFYLQARREWDERYGDLVLGKRNWQIASAGLMLVSLVLALGIVWMSGPSKVITYIVEVDKLSYGCVYAGPGIRLHRLKPGPLSSRRNWSLNSKVTG